MIIDKSQDINELFFTFDTRIEEHVLLVLTNEFSKDKKTFELTDNVSQFVFRYYQYNLNKSEFIELEEGLYSYQVLASSKIIEEGSLKIIDTSVSTDIISVEEDNTYIVYDN